VTETKHSPRRIGRRLALSAGILLAAFAVAILALYGLAQSGSGRAWLARTVAAALSTPGEVEVAIDGLEGPLPQAIRLRRLTVSDRQGPWLTADSVALDWRPLALLSGEVRITGLRIAEVSVARSPEAAPDAAGAAPLSVPSLPVDLSMERLSVERVVLGAPVLGQAAVFRVSGEAAAEKDDRILSSLVIERTDGTAGRAAITAAYTPRDQLLSLDVDVHEPAGGLIARALDLPEAPALSATVKGDGPLADWRGEMKLAAADLASFDAVLELRRTDALAYRLTGTATSSMQVPAPWSRLAAGETAFDMAGEWRPDRTLTMHKGRFEGPAARVEVSGRLDLDGMAIEARADAALKDTALIGDLLPGAAAKGMTLAVTVGGTVPAPTLRAVAKADALSAPDIEARGVAAELSFAPAPNFAWATPRGSVKARGTIETVSAAHLADVEPLLGRRYSWHLDGTLDLDHSLLEASDLAVEAGAVRVGGGGRLDLATGGADARLRIAVADLAGLTPLLQIAVAGRSALDADVAALDFGKKISAKLTGTLQEVVLGEPALQAMLGGESTVSAAIAVSPEDGLSLTDIEIAAAAARVEGRAGLGAGYRKLDARYRVQVPDIGILSEALGLKLSGSGEIRGRAEGPIAKPVLKGGISIADGGIAGIAAGRLAVAYEARDVATKPTGLLELVAVTPKGRIDGRADYLLDGPALRLTSIEARSKGSRLHGNLTAPTDGRPLTGTLAIDAADLGPWLALGGIDGGGAATGDLRLHAAGKRQGATLKARLSALAWRTADGEAMQAKSADVDWTTADLTGTLAGSLDLAAQEVRAGDLRLAEMTLRGKGDRSQADLSLAASGTYREPLSLKAAGRLRIAEDSQSLDLTKAEGRAFGQPLALRKPASIRRRGETLELRLVDLAFGAAGISASGRVATDRLTASLRVDALPVASLAAWLPTAGQEGAVSGLLELDGPPSNPAGRLRLTAAGLKLDPKIADRPFELTLSAELRDRRAKLAGRITGPLDRDAELSADVPLRLDADRLAAAIPADEPWTGRLSWRGELASVWPLVPLDGHQLTGTADLAVALGGSPSAPSLRGTLTMDDGRYENLTTGTLLEAMRVRLTLDGRRAVLSELSATDGGAGKLSATGEATIEPDRGYPFKIDADITDFTAVRRDEVTALSDGRATVSGDAKRLTVAGKFETRSVEIRLIDRMPPAVASLDVVEAGTAGKEAIFRGHPQPLAAAMETVLDIGITMPRRVFVRGRGLDSEWSGAFTVTGPAEQPSIDGELTLVRGVMSVAGKDFRLTSGTIRIPGGKEIQPVLDIAAQHRARDLQVTVRISGPADAPTIALSSVPEMPRDEIISRMLFGKTTTQLSAIEAAQLAAAAAELSGAGGGAGGVLDFARSLIGVDVLRIETAGTAEKTSPAIRAGKYVTDDIYVGVKKGVSGATSNVGVEVELTPNIVVESETGEKGGSDIGIKFKWDY